jgi:hypothetical protein
MNTRVLVAGGCLLLAVGMLIGAAVGRSWHAAPPPACIDRAHGTLRLDIGDHGVQMKLEGAGD